MKHKTIQQRAAEVAALRATVNEAIKALRRAEDNLRRHERKLERFEDRVTGRPRDRR